MPTTFERTLQRTFRIGFVGMLFFFVLFLIYSIGGAIAIVFTSFEFDYAFMSLQSNPDPVFSVLGTVFGIFICIETFSVIWLTYFGRGMEALKIQDEIAILAGFIGLGFGAAVVRHTLPLTMQVLTDAIL